MFSRRGQGSSAQTEEKWLTGVASLTISGFYARRHPVLHHLEQLGEDSR